MKQIDIKVNTLSELPLAANKLLEQISFEANNTSLNLSKHRIIAFYGPLGSGKTTLIKEICRQLGSIDDFSSPSYSLVNEYSLGDSTDKLYHIDLYRLKTLQEALAIGIEEYMDGQHYCFIEWPELIEPILSENAIKVRLEAAGDMRKISIFIPSAKGE